MDGLTFFLMSLKLDHIRLTEEDSQCELLGVGGQIISMESSLEMETCQEMVGKRMEVYSEWLLRAKLFPCSKHAEHLHFHHMLIGPSQSVTYRQEN